MADRTIPEDEDPRKKPTPVMPGKPRPNFAPGLKEKVRNKALERRITAHQQHKAHKAHKAHVAHTQHMANVKANPKKYERLLAFQNKKK